MKGILFNTEMVQAILEGRKTSTRRIIKNIPQKCDFQGVVTSTTGNNSLIGKLMFGIGCICTYIKPPYQAGDILYVRETWTVCKVKKPVKAIPVDFKDIMYFYKADGIANSDGSSIKWHPSIHMPREAARIFLKVTDVRVERVQDITEEGAKAEGCIDFEDKIGDGKFEDVIEFDLTAIDAFIELWNSTIKRKDINKYGWGPNPYVWVISFERTEGEK